MNFAHKAKKLQEERLERERVASQEQARAKAEIAETEQQVAELARQKTEGLLLPFKQFDGFKICDQHVTIGAEMKHAGHESSVCLKTVSVDLCVLRQYTPNALLLSAHYDPESGSYHLNRHENPVKALGSWIAAGEYESADDLMNAVAAEVSKL